MCRTCSEIISVECRPVSMHSIKCNYRWDQTRGQAGFHPYLILFISNLVMRGFIVQPSCCLMFLRRVASVWFGLPCSIIIINACPVIINKTHPRLNGKWGKSARKQAQHARRQSVVPLCQTSLINKLNKLHKNPVNSCCFPCSQFPALSFADPFGSMFAYALLANYILPAVQNFWKFLF